MSSPPKVHPADVIVPTFEVFEYLHVLSLPENVVNAEEKAQARAKLLEALKSQRMVLHMPCHSDPDLGVKLVDVCRYADENEAIEEKLKKAVKEAKEQYGDVEVKDARLELAHHYCRIGDWEKAVRHYTRILEEKALESGGKIDILLTIVRIGLFTNDLSMVKEYLAKAEKQFEVGGDWERRNRLRVYKAVHLASNERRIGEAAELLLSSLATFSATELMSFNQFVTQAVLLSMCGLSRPTLIAKVANSPEVLQVFSEDPVLRTFFQSFIGCNYKVFFQYFTRACDKIRRDRYLHMHYRYFVRNMRLIAFRQYLEPFKSVTLPAMTAAFGVSEEFLEDEIVSFISSGKLNCKIDRIAKTIESSNSQTRNELFQQVVKSGDSLINRIQMLSRVIDL